MIVCDVHVLGAGADENVFVIIAVLQCQASKMESMPNHYCLHCKQNRVLRQFGTCTVNGWLRTISTRIDTSSREVFKKTSNYSHGETMTLNYFTDGGLPLKSTQTHISRIIHHSRVVTLCLHS